MRVFILEDDPTRMHILRERLIGHEIDHADSCRQVKRFKPPYDLILLDHDLGGRQLVDHEDDGTAFVKLIANKVRSGVVVFHSYNAAGAQRMYDELGFGFIAPFCGMEFNAILRGMLRKVSQGQTADLDKHPKPC